jgi:transcriptional regulator GlxA family with amidase domain
MEVSSGQSMWLIPPCFALWIPVRTQHRIHMPRAVSMRTLYFAPGQVSVLPSSCAVLHVSSILRELILETVRLGKLRNNNRLERALRDLTVFHIEKASPLPSFLTLPRQPQALVVAKAILESPGQSQSLAALCAGAGASVRTIQRAFQRDIGIDFETWRRQARVIKAIELLVAGFSVKEVSFAVGYRQSSAFVESFRRTFGTTPSTWVSQLGKLDGKAPGS